MIQLNRFEIECFINKVFYYYNGRINTFNNKLQLFINWLTFPATNNGGRYMHPNVLTVFPSVIERWNDTIATKAIQENDDSFSYANNYKVIVIESIIHELYHADQVLIRGRYNDLSAENPVITETTLYMASHQNEIYDIFDVVVDMDFAKINEILPQPYFPYCRRDIASHAVSVMSDMLFGDREYVNKMISAFNFVTVNGYGTISILIGNEDFTVTDDGKWYDINEFNDFTYRYFCKSLERKCTILFAEIPGEENWWVLSIQDLILRDPICTIEGGYKDVEDES